jgi:hypothetical protein
MKEKYVHEWEERCKNFEHLTPHTCESFYYRSIFHELYGFEAEKCIPYFWMPKWSGNTKDPSARTLSHY